MAGFGSAPPTFGYNGSAINYTTAGVLSRIETNVLSLVESDLQVRFFCDIIKDTNTAESPITPNHCDTLLRTIYPTYPQRNLIPYKYKTYLHELEYALFNDPTIKAQTTELKNILKTSTVGSNTQISYATYVFFESGFGTKMICANSDVNIIGTPASIMDPAGKEKHNIFFPSYDIIFDKTFTKRLGFPNTVWKYIGGHVTIEYTDGSEIIGQISSDTTSNDVKHGRFGNYVKGNKEKNDKLYGLMRNTLLNRSEIFKILETKELGDVAQVWLYLAYVVNEEIRNSQTPTGFDRTKVVMITTDSVVYLLCVLLRLSCVYTGAREGVTSGGCTLKYFLAGTVNYKNKIKTIVDNEYKRALEHVRGQVYAFRLIILDGTLNKYSYMKLERGGKMRKTYGSTNIGLKKNAIIAILKKYQANVELLENSINEIYSRYDREIETTDFMNDEMVTTTFTRFLGEIKQHIIAPYFTKLQDKKYMLNPSDLMSEIATELEIDSTTIPRDIKEITHTLLQGGNSSLSKNIKKKNVGGSKKGFFEISFQECLIITIIYIELCGGYRIEPDKFIFSKERLGIISMKYDRYVFEINQFSTSEYHGAIANAQKMFTTEEIFRIGLTISEHMYFAEDLYDETRLLEEEILGLMHTLYAPPNWYNLRNSGGPTFENNVWCENKIDVITYTKIGQGLGVYLRNVGCLDVRTIVKMMVENIHTKDIHTQDALFDFRFFKIEDPNMRVNIFAFIYMYYYKFYEFLKAQRIVGGKGRSFRKKNIANKKINKNTRKKQNNKNNKSKKKV